MSLKEFLLNLLITTVIGGLTVAIVSWFAAHGILSSVVDPEQVYGVTPDGVLRGGWKIGTFGGFFFGLFLAAIRIIKKPPAIHPSERTEI